MITQLDAFADLIDASYPPRAAVPYQWKSATSREGAQTAAVRSHSHERDVLNEIIASGAHGISRKELAESIGWADRQMNRITGRVSTLVKRGLVHEDHVIEYDRLGEPLYQVRRRDGSAVLIATGRQG